MSALIYHLVVGPWQLRGYRFFPMEEVVIDIKTGELIVEVCVAGPNAANEIAHLRIERGDDRVARVTCTVDTFAYLVRKGPVDDRVYEVRGDMGTWIAWEGIERHERCLGALTGR